MSLKLLNKVALVTGASRGIGKGIALQLGEHGAKVYITGRKLTSKDDLSLEKTAEEIRNRGGQCFPVQCDHEDDKQVEKLFQQIKDEQNGQLDLLVNSAFKAGDFIFEAANLNFWETDPAKTWDDINNVGLRNNYLCTVHASRLMVPRQKGLIVNISSLGGLQYAFHACYGIGKAGVDRISSDCGLELRKHNVACLSLLLNGVRTEFSEQILREKGDKANFILFRILFLILSRMSKNRPLAGKVALVTGATRGIGKGIALQLGQAGALVYITGRTLKSTNNLGSLEQTANEIKERGGVCIPVQVNHESDHEIAELFQKIETEQNGILDILVNNAYKGVTTIFEGSSLEFWKQKPEVWDEINNVGLRNHYICTVYAARMMVPRKQGLIINISSFGGMSYIFNVAYGVGKAAVDRMAVDCGKELSKHNVVMLSLYPGAVKTELVTDMISKQNPDISGISGKQISMKKVFEQGESIEFAGKCIVSLAQDKNLSKYTSKVVIAADYARAHGIKDVDGRQITSFKQLKSGLLMSLPDNLKWIANLVPGFISIPQFRISTNRQLIN
ncbi:dehydrogenase reductase SDR family member 1-like [Brachionus plicatilis]|uniref:Dehydrogenase reductase SDR family member 1-like n=1 Tax=Brachionus plicatilis TaxID=10195 RepID=A0A3M7S5W3_BRAPC|nr:dehydrogenase reductase SDR family member 1-like [Brachionus plicatilis]